MFKKGMFDKEFSYTWMDASPEKRQKVHRVISALAAEGAYTNIKIAAVHLRQKMQGNQMWVSKEVSDDLQLADIDEIDFGNLPWPHDVLEFYFEDPEIPTTLFHKRRHGDNIRLIRDVTGVDLTYLFDTESSNDAVYDLLIGRHNGRSAGQSTLTAALINDSVREGFYETHRAADAAWLAEYRKIATDLPEEEESEEANGVEVGNAMLRMVALLYKILLFASSEGCAPRKTTDQPTRKQGGKAGFKGRPKTPRMIVEYLPRHRKERKEQASEATGKTHEFNGRRGHWRVYQSERYVNMRGKRVFMYPVPDKHGNYPKRQFRVVKPR